MRDHPTGNFCECNQQRLGKPADSMDFQKTFVKVTLQD